MNPGFDAIVAVGGAAVTAVLGYGVQRILAHLDRIDASVNRLNVNIAVLFDRDRRGLPTEEERQAVAAKIEQTNT